jgi:hypothetical protein
MMYLLARNPNLQDELYAELLEVHGPEDIVQLPLVRGMMREALRLYPVAPFLSRYMPENSLIGSYHVPAGVSISYLCVPYPSPPPNFQDSTQEDYGITRYFCYPFDIHQSPVVLQYSSGRCCYEKSKNEH